ncbi:MAG: hypothetical protein AAFQ65_05195 [Myxococcota bacterium]
MLRYVLNLSAFAAQALLISAFFACGTNDVDSPSNNPVSEVEPGADAGDAGDAGDAESPSDSDGDEREREENPEDREEDTKKAIGARCTEDTECESAQCEGGSCLGQRSGCELDDVQRTPGGVGWMDSYSVDGRCFCDTTFDHNIAEIEVETPDGSRTVKEVCDTLGPGPGRGDNPIFNDIQCGNGPANDAGDEDWCPGRVDQGDSGCCTIGPRWNFDEG